MRKGFTLVELLIVASIVAILSAVLCPVFASAKDHASRGKDLSNIRQLGAATQLYLGDNNDNFYPHSIECKDATNTPTTCAQYLDVNGRRLPEAAKFSGGSETRYYWLFMLKPYSTGLGVFKDPGYAQAFSPEDDVVMPCRPGYGCKGNNFGAQNSYGHNDAYLSPDGVFGDGLGHPRTVNQSSVPRVASTIMIANAGYFGVAPDSGAQSGYADLSKFTVPGDTSAELRYLTRQGKQYKFYWKNLGNANWSYSGGEAGPLAAGHEERAVALGMARHGGNINCQFVDGHARAIPYRRVVGDICLWTTDVEGPHPACGG